MANKIIGRTDTSGAVTVGSIASNANRPVLIVGASSSNDAAKEVIFDIRGTNDAVTNFGAKSPCVDIARVLIRNGVRLIKGICIGSVGTKTTTTVTKTRKVNKVVAAGTDGNPTVDTDGDYTIIDNPETYVGNTATVEVDEEYTEEVTTITGGTYGSEKDAYAAAFEKSLNDASIMCIILDKSDSTLYSSLASHMEDAENADIYRYGVVGVPSTVTTVDGATAIAAAINSPRMFVAYPNVVDDDNKVLDGALTAAGIASVLNTQTDDPALPTNNIGFVGFGGTTERLVDSDMDKLASAGVVPIYPDNSVPTVYRMVTTAQKMAFGSGTDSTATDSIWHDATTRLIADNVLSTVLAKLKANYRRTKNVSRVLDSIRTDVISVLDQKLGLEIIESYDQSLVSVIKDPDDRYGALVDFEYQVVSPLYTITVTQHVKI